MDRDLRVNPADLRSWASQADTYAANLRSGHASAHERITTAQSGFIGASSAALAARLAHWEEETAAHHAELIVHSEHLRSAAKCYADTDDAEAVRLNDGASGLADRMNL
ncbi:WXG100 family type VII secretion target [Mycobacterium shimoidei]|jgi:WXG100 family type VII secretion target|uniref:ESX-1 secretion-associated protein n=2 Tax=Mycobacterium shimoidei TaxID=29313 RepID=A0A1E3TIC4_MYCSH|nr:WXG100 family type VII secretion target [Mycobacterium shimoidei]ODR14176.1 hypothetical protein BHQ16_07020 [Mycobacterium shimoidei]ORW83928.1 hypothetical protein AWC26_00450 [Mycobacterium shimoidei]SRX91884.1 hypothetical protein MSP7336_00105 [Mycobacterium shimoidei]